jgi:hypothetical protein
MTALLCFGPPLPMLSASVSPATTEIANTINADLAHDPTEHGNICAWGPSPTPLPFERTVLAAGDEERFGADHPEILVGTWALDLKEFSLGSDPDERLDGETPRFNKVTTTTLSRVSDAIIHGRTLRFSGVGPIGDPPKALIGIEGSDAYRWYNNTLIRQSDPGHGMKKHDIVTISPDGETMTIRDSTTAPHGVAAAILVTRRQTKSLLAIDRRVVFVASFWAI